MKKLLLCSLLSMSFATMSAADASLFNVSPAEGTVENIYRLMLTSTSTNSMYMYDKFAEEKAYLLFTPKGATEAQHINLYLGEDRSGIEFIPETVVYTAGTCELVIPGGSISGFDMTSPNYDETTIEETLTYKFRVTGGITNPEPLPFTVSPEPGSQVEALEVTFTSTDPKVAMTPNMNPSYSNVYFAKDGAQVCLANVEPSEDGLTLVVTPEEEITEGGTYDLIFSYLSLYSYDPSEFFPQAQPCKDLMGFSYKFGDDSGIDSIEAEKASTAVYNLYGIKVDDSLDGLTPGLYITNGKKILVK